jgi:hypothetical protein
METAHLSAGWIGYDALGIYATQLYYHDLSKLLGILKGLVVMAEEFVGQKQGKFQDVVTPNSERVSYWLVF